MNKAIVDIESFIYRSCTATNVLIEKANGIYIQGYKLSNAIDYIEETINDICGVTGCDDVLLAFGSTRNYRKILSPEYKANRKDSVKHPMLGKVISTVAEKFNSTYIDWLEADDVCRIVYTSNPFDYIVVSIDKDLKSFPCKLYNPNEPDKCVQEITTKEAARNFARQVLGGDKADGYSGLKGYGEVKIEKLLDSMPDYNIDTIKDTFINSGGELIDFINNYNMARILSRDEYYEGKGLKLYNTYFDFDKGVQVERL